MKSGLKGILFGLCATFAVGQQAIAGVVGPQWPAPGGTSYVSNGVNPGSGIRVETFSGFDVTGLSGLYYGLDQLNYGPAGAGLNGSPDPFSLFVVSGQTAVWTGTTSYLDQNDGWITADTRMTWTVAGLGATPWITNLASVGLDTGFGDLGAVIDNSLGQDFTLSWTIQADVGNGFQFINAIPQQQSQDGKTSTSVARGFYSVSVPEPATLVLLMLGLAAVLAGESRKARSEQA
ncbi:MAG: PEP-CTERM sorting domain-containing protein [Pseudomonadota bacterium]